MKEEDTSTRRITSGGGGSSGGGGGASDGTDVNVGALSATDIRGGITLLGDYYGPEMDSIFTPCKGTVLAAEVEAYIALFKMGEEMKVLEYDNEYCTIYLNTGLTARVRRAFVKMAGDVEEAKFTGYVRKNGTALYKDYQFRTEAMQLGRNKTVDVLYKLPAHMYEGDEVYVVSAEGEIMYMHVSTISDKKVKVSTGGGSSGGGGDVWTPTAM